MTDSTQATRSSLFARFKNWLADAKIKEAKRLRRAVPEMLDRANRLEADAIALKGTASD